MEITNNLRKGEEDTQENMFWKYKRATTKLPVEQLNKIIDAEGKVVESEVEVNEVCAISTSNYFKLQKHIKRGTESGVNRQFDFINKIVHT